MHLYAFVAELLICIIIKTNFVQSCMCCEKTKTSGNKTKLHKKGTSYRNTPPSN